MKVLVYLILMLVVIYCGFLLYQKIFEDEATTKAEVATTPQVAAPVSVPTSGGPISQTKLMQRTKNINDQHNASISRQ